MRASREDPLRLQDLRVRHVREAAQEAIYEHDYFASLRISLSFWLNPFDWIERLADLSMRTNQFNLSLTRINGSRISALIKNARSDVVSVALADCLIDSGVIFMVVATLKGDVLIIEDICLNYRALGRNLEDSIILKAIKIMDNFAKCKSVAFKYTAGPL